MVRTGRGVFPRLGLFPPPDGVFVDAVAAVTLLDRVERDARSRPSSSKDVGQLSEGLKREKSTASLLRQDKMNKVSYKLQCGNVAMHKKEYI